LILLGVTTGEITPVVFPHRSEICRLRSLSDNLVTFELSMRDRKKKFEIGENILTNAIGLIE